VISIIENNEAIKTKMSENLKSDIDKATSRPLNSNVINVVINIKDNDNAIDSSQKVEPSFFKGREGMRVNSIIEIVIIFQRSQSLLISSISS